MRAKSLRPRFRDFARFGVDAPFWLGGFALVAAVSAVECAHLLRTTGNRNPFTIIFFASFCVFFGGMITLLFGSTLGKVREARSIVSSIAWRGDERVLDAGCGRGLLLVQAARLLPSGFAVGADIWRSRDLLRNTVARTKNNLLAAGFTKRAALCHADVRHLSFMSESFDVVLSSYVVHNLANRHARTLSISELARVLKPGGTLVILDLLHTRTYLQQLLDAGFEAQRKRVVWLFSPTSGRVTARKTRR